MKNGRKRTSEGGEKKVWAEEEEKGGREEPCVATPSSNCVRGYGWVRGGKMWGKGREGGLLLRWVQGIREGGRKGGPSLIG